MSTDETNLNDLGHLEAQVRTMQIIAGAIIMGLVTFAAITVGLTIEKPPGDPMLPYIAAGVSLITVGVWAVVPSSLANTQAAKIRSEHQNDDPERLAERLASVYQTRTVIAYAILEGTGFFCLISYLVSAQSWILAAAGVLLSLMIFTFPTRNRFEDWVEHQRFS